MVDEDVRAVLRARHVNVLIVGSNSDAEAILATLDPCWCAVRHHWPQVPARSALSVGHPCTLFVRQVAELSSADLEALQELMDQSISPVQVVSTATQEIFSKV